MADTVRVAFPVAEWLFDGNGITSVEFADLATIQFSGRFFRTIAFSPSNNEYATIVRRVPEDIPQGVRPRLVVHGFYLGGPPDGVLRLETGVTRLAYSGQPAVQHLTVAHLAPIVRDTGTQIALWLDPAQLLAGALVGVRLRRNGLLNEDTVDGVDFHVLDAELVW